VFEPDLARGRWGAPAREEALRRFLRGSRAPRFELITHAARPLESGLPRLARVLREHAHAVGVRQTTEAARHAADAFNDADGKHVWRRFHHERPRGELALFAPEDATIFARRFAELREASEPAWTATTLGL
jgi:hypothetical protein